MVKAANPIHTLGWVNGRGREKSAPPLAIADRPLHANHVLLTIWSIVIAGLPWPPGRFEITIGTLRRRLLAS
jgi:hypothetical protein